MERAVRDLKSQKTKWQEVIFATLRPVVSPVAATTPKSETGRPPGTPVGAPYWEFSWQITPDTGLKLTNLVVRDTMEAGSSETVADTVDFTDFAVVFNDTTAGTFEPFPIATAFAHKESSFQYGVQGESTASGVLDTLYQQGMRLKLVHEFGGTCKVTVRISIVFRGAINDFDPGGVPFSLNFYPQIAYSWEGMPGSKRRVKQFRGSVRITANNQTPAMGSHPGVADNVVNFWTDSNISKNPYEDRVETMKKGASGTVLPLALMYAAPAPFGWGIVFDYNRIDLKEEQEYDAVYGPLDDPLLYYSTRTLLYHWPQSGAAKVNDFKVEKVPRQGYYDNIHLHGRMHAPDKRGNEQIHAPFCGHSCLHMHWRWSSISSNAAVGGRGWYYKGWSIDNGAEAFSQAGAPLIPPNQKLTVAICKPDRTRASPAKILPPAGSRAALEKGRKLIWYCVDIADGFYAKLNQGEQQVIMEHGVGWAYRYAYPFESFPVYALYTALAPIPLPPTIDELLALTQSDLMYFFEDRVYPSFRYWAARVDGSDIVTNQIPEGTLHDVMAGPPQSMESL